MEGTVHIAGDTLTIFGRFMRQRCSWCGIVLVEYDLEKVAVQVGDPPPGSFSTGALVLVDGGMMAEVPLELEVDSEGMQSGKLPNNACAHNPLTIPD